MPMHEYYLKRCIALAEKRLGFCAPNPAVGAVVVKNNHIIAEGYHDGCGHPHAEVVALNQLNESLEEATLYVSLEPCCHYGRTPPCTEKIKQSGIKKVFFGLRDPNPIVAGKGQQQLRDWDIACEKIDMPTIDDFYKKYRYWTQHKKPYVTAKLATTADGKIALSDKKPVKITGIACDQLTHRYRYHSDAILTTIETVLNDDPQLTARYDNAIIKKPIYILDSQCRLPLSAKVIDTAELLTVFHAKDAHLSLIDALMKKGVRCIAVDNDFLGLDLNTVMHHIGLDGKHDLWVEAGGRCMDALFKTNQCNEFILYVSKKALGSAGLSSAVKIEELLQYFKNCDRRDFNDDVFYHFKNPIDIKNK